MVAGDWSWSRRTARHVRGLLVVGLAVVFAGCVYDPVYYGPTAYPDYRPDYYDYYYYPSAGVYFHFTSGYYYYRSGSRWLQVRHLPSHIHIDARDRVKLRIDSDKPYLRHKEHHRQYKPRPDYHADKEREARERAANRHWYQKYGKTSEKHDKRERKEDRDRGRGKERSKDSDKDWKKNKDDDWFMNKRDR